MVSYFAVITEVGNGNYACGEMLINPEADHHVVGANIIVDPPFHVVEEYFSDAVKRGRDTTIDLTKEQMVFCNVPVFKVGEILIMDSNDRTIPDGRKPDRWDVKYEIFDDANSAAKRAKEVYDKGGK